MTESAESSVISASCLPGGIVAEKKWPSPAANLPNGCRRRTCHSATQEDRRMTHIPYALDIWPILPMRTSLTSSPHLDCSRLRYTAHQSKALRRSSGRLNLGLRYIDISSHLVFSISRAVISPYSPETSYSKSTTSSLHHGAEDDPAVSQRRQYLLLSHHRRILSWAAQRR